MNNWKTFVDDFGLMSIGSDGVKGHNTQNGAMWTAEFLVALKAAHLVRHAEIPGYVSMKDYLALWDAMSSCQGPNGETYRHPGKAEEWDSMDNMVAHFVFMSDEDKKRWYMSGSDKLDKVDEHQGTLPQEYTIVKYAKLAKLIGYNGSYFPWAREPMYWNNTRPDEFATFPWYGRSAGFMAWIDLAVFGKTTLLRHTVLIVEQLRQCFTKGMGAVDGIRMTYLAFQFLRKVNPIYRLTYKLWCRSLIKNYPRGMQEVYEIARANNTDPITKIEVKYAK